MSDIDTIMREAREHSIRVGVMPNGHIVFVGPPRARRVFQRLARSMREAGAHAWVVENPLSPFIFLEIEIKSKSGGEHR